jgi:hypothetical protein
LCIAQQPLRKSAYSAVNYKVQTGQTRMYLNAQSRVARWHIFKPKIPIWVNFGWSCNGWCWHVLAHFVYFIAIWYILWALGKFYGSLVYFPPFWSIIPRKIWHRWPKGTTYWHAAVDISGKGCELDLKFQKLKALHNYTISLCFLPTYVYRVFTDQRKMSATL